MKKIIALAVGTAAVIALAIAVQANAGSGHDDEGKQPPSVSPTEAPAPGDGATTALSPGATDSSDGANEDDGAREGSTEDHEGKPGESK